MVATVLFSWQHKFISKIEDDEHMEKFIMENLGTKWREKRGWLWRKAKCDETQGVEFNISKRPTLIDARDWDTFCRYKCSKEYLEASPRNKSKPGNQDIYHTKESKPFNRVREHLEQENGGLVGRTEVFLKCYE